MAWLALDAISDINLQNNQQQFIRDAFVRCGLNPWSEKKSLQAFKDHLDKLEENDVLKTMLQNQKSIVSITLDGGFCWLPAPIWLQWNNNRFPPFFIN